MKKSIKYINQFLCLALFIFLLMPSILTGQTRAGSAYLKIIPGARQQGLANSMTGALDEPYTFYVNPGATGLLREWQFSATYTKWIADIYNLSLLYGRKFQLNTLFGDGLTAAIGLNYQGIELGSSQNLSGAAMVYLHLDFWTANSTDLGVFLISPGPVETEVLLVPPGTTGSWVSVDIPLTDFAPVDLADVIQLKFRGNGDIYLDNILFRK